MAKILPFGFFGMLGVKNIVQRSRTIKLCLVFKSHYSVIFYTSL